jgi:hypothetical protein
VRRFNLYRRGKIYYVRYWDEKTQSYASGKSTGETDERAAMATAAHWDKYGFPDGSSPQSVTDIHAILETARTAPLEPVHVQKLVSILADRGMLDRSDPHRCGTGLGTALGVSEDLLGIR